MKELAQVTEETQAKMRRRWNKGDWRGKEEYEMAPQGVSGSPEWPLVPLPSRSFTTTALALCTCARTGSAPLLGQSVLWTSLPATKVFCAPPCDIPEVK